MTKGMTCSMCNHEHTKTDGPCDCGCMTMKADGEGKVCTMCNHEHKNKARVICKISCAKRAYWRLKSKIVSSPS